MTQAIYIAIGFCGMVTVFNINMDKWEELALPLFIAAAIVLLIVLVPFIGREVNGARRWIPSEGRSNFQPSELMKMAMVVYTARYAVRHREAIARTSNLWMALSGVSYPLPARWCWLSV
ncbi:peptidoglycan glycosyltransferase FtsW [Oligella ureolytica]